MSAATDALKEQRLLTASIVVVAAMAVASLVFGLWSGSSAITFDGFYNLADAGLTGLALFIAKLIPRGENERFQYGYWHLEPLLGLVNGSVLAITCAYAFGDGLNGLLRGGREIEVGAGAAFSGGMTVLSLAMYVYIKRASAGLNSQFLQVGARGWLMGTGLSAALFVSFLIAFLMRGSAVAHLAPLIDPLVLILVSLALLPFPFLTLWRAGADILQIAPPGLSERVREVTREVASRHGFNESTSHVARSGRHLFVEIGLVAPSAEIETSYRELDAIRLEIAAALGGIGPGYWLTVDFTADSRWL